MVRTYAIPLLIHISIGFLITGFYFSQSAIRWEAILVHIAVLVAFWAFLYSTQTVLLSFSQRRKAIFRFSGGLLLLFSAWYLIQHITSFIAFLFWSEGVSFFDLLSYLPHLPAFLSHLGISKGVASMAAVLISTVLILLYGIWLRQILKYEVDSPVPGQNKLLLNITVLAISLSVLSGFIYQIQSGKLLSLRGEPFADFFRTSEVYDLRYKPIDFDITGHLEERRRFAEQHSDYGGDLPNIIIILLDAARADRMSVYDYHRNTTPTLDSLHATGRMVKAEFATTPCPHSECGIGAMLSSLFYLRVHPVNYKLHEVFNDLGYDTNFLLSGDHSGVYGFMKEFYGADVTLFRDGFDAPDRYPTDDTLLLDFIEDVPPNHETENPAFFYFHMMSTHTMGARYERFNTYHPNDFPGHTALMAKGRFSRLDEAEAELISNNYDNGVQQADAFTGKILNRLSAKGYLENAIVVVTSDHGEGLGENNIFGHAQHLHKSTLQIPLLFYFTDPGFQSRTEIPFGSIQDIGPTLLGKIGIDSPQEWEGVDLLNNSRTYSHHMSPFKPDINAVIVQEHEDFFMLIASANDEGNRVYNLTKDPFQTNNIANSIHSDLLNRLKSALEKEFK